jgi:hypothetical protein
MLAQNTKEAAFVLSFVLLAYVSFAFLLNMIWDYISEYREENLKIEHYLNVMKRYLKTKNISSDTQVKVSSYLEYYLAQEKARERDLEDELITKLSPEIKKELIVCKIKIYIYI